MDALEAWHHLSTNVNTWHTGQVTETLALRAERLTSACCPPVVGPVMGVDQAEALASSLRALADPNRLRLVSLVAACADGEACVCELTEPVGLSQPTVSHHLKILVDAGVLTREQRGKWAYYRLVAGALDSVARRLSADVAQA